MYIKKSTSGYFARWTKTIDLLNLSLIILLLMLGVLFVTTASPSIAIKKGLTEFYFIKKHYIFVILSIFCLLFFSFISQKGLINISTIGLGISFILLIFVLIQEQKNNGAVRWIQIFGFSLQPSEFLKPFLIVSFANLFSNKINIRLGRMNLKSNFFAFLLLFSICILLLMQPNFSMIAIIFCVFFSQYFIAGLSIKLASITLISILMFSCTAYFSLPHVKNRISDYLSPNKLNFQIEKSMKAYQEGGILGKGPGEGEIKNSIPDAHTDFIFPVVAEEYGLLACFSIIVIFFTIFFRGLFRVNKIGEPFSIISCTGFLVLFMFQALINVSVSIRLIPTTGVTLPLISYGGSSLVSMCIALGMMLSLTKRKYGGRSKL